MIKRIMLVVFTILLVTITACSAINNVQNLDNNKDTTDNLSFTDIKPEDAKKRIDSEEEIILLDVRTQEEYIERHIPDSILIPVDVIEQEAPSKLTDKDAAIFVYCRSGRRSEIASAALVKMGYTKVYNLGGINDWAYETVSGE